MSRRDDVRTENIAMPRGRATDSRTGRQRNIPPPPDRGPSPLARPIFLFGLAIFVISICFPATGWILRQQLRLALGGDLPGTQASLFEFAATKKVASETKAEIEYASQQGNDFEVQLAHAIQNVPPVEPGIQPSQSTRRVDSLLRLGAKFDNRPELHATILRFLCMGSITSVPRDGSLLLEAQNHEDIAKGLKGIADRQKTLNPIRVAQFEAAAKRGEQLDPENAFFPQMLSVVLFTLNRDDEALSTLHRAAQKPHWEDYSVSQLQGQLRILEGTQGKVGVISQSVYSAALLFPHFATLRSAARVAVYSAVLAEQKGDTKTGLQIRHDVARIGAKMRAQGRYIIASLVGQAITNATMLRPGGIPAEPSAKGDVENSHKLDTYLGYLNRVGASNEARWLRLEKLNQNEAKVIWSNGENKTLWEPTRLVRLVAQWGAGTLCLANAILLLVFGGIATWLARLPHFRRAEPLPRGVSAGLSIAGMGILMAIVNDIQASINSSGSESSPDGWVNALLPVVLGLTIVLAILKTKETWCGFRRNLWHFLVTLASCIALFVPIRLFATGMASGMGILPSLALLNGFSNVPTVPALFLFSLSFVGVVGTILVSVFKREKGLPASIKIVRTLRNTAPITSTIFLLITVVLGVSLSVLENQMQSELSKMLQHEGRYVSELVHREWPGEVVE